MNKKIIGMPLAAASLLSLNGFAQTQTTTGNAPNKECVAGKCNQTSQATGKKEKRAKANPFDNLNLSDSQKAQLQQLGEKKKAERMQQSQAKKENKMRNDSAKIADRRSDRKEYLEEVKAIIGPENYVVFLENFYVNGGSQRHGNKAALSHGHGYKAKAMKGKGDRRGGKGTKTGVASASAAIQANS